MRLFPNVRIKFEKLFDKWSIGHFLASGVLGLLFGFFPAILFAAYYDFSQSYMYHERLVPKHWSWLERSIFSSNKITDLYDVLVWDLVGAMAGALVGYLVLGYPFYGFLGA